VSDLLKINVNEHTEKKGNLTYLSWAWAWAEVLKIDPKATWEANAKGLDGPAMFFPDGSAMVGVSVTIKDHAKSCLLPVMDHKNKAIKNPDAFAINTAIMRCLAKAIAMHGLGLYIYAGEDLPEAEAEPPEPEAVPMAATAVVDWLSAINTAAGDELRSVREHAIDAATKAKDRDAFLSFRAAAKRRAEALGVPA